MFNHIVPLLAPIHSYENKVEIVGPLPHSGFSTLMNEEDLGVCYIEDSLTLKTCLESLQIS
jgi:hypothetical protein